jgi:hypothetical protein
MFHEKLVRTFMAFPHTSLYMPSCDCLSVIVIKRKVNTDFAQQHVVLLRTKAQVKQKLHTFRRWIQHDMAVPKQNVSVSEVHSQYSGTYL